MKDDYSISSRMSNFLNFLRWISAFLVLIAHLRSVIFVGAKDAGSLNVFWKIFYLLTDFGYQAVMVFFVLSGFLVGSSILKRAKNNNLSFINYLLYDRGVRIYIVLIPAITLTAFLDIYGLTNFDKIGVYTGNLELSSLSYSVANRLGLDIFLGNLLMLQGSIVPTFGSNFPLWSLAYEVWYYILFFSIVSILSKKHIFVKFIYLNIIILSIFLLNINIILYFSIWLLGVLIWFVYKKIKINKYFVFTLFFVFLMMNRLHIFIVENRFLIDFLLSATIAMLIMLVMQNKIAIYNSFINKFLSNFSYSLYLTHFPLLLFILTYLNYSYDFNIRVKPSLEYLGYFVIIFILVSSISYLFYFFTEKNTKKIQNKTKTKKRAIVIKYKK